MSAAFHVRQANPEDVVCKIFLNEFYIFPEISGGQDIILQLIIDLVRFGVISSLIEGGKKNLPST